MRRKATLGDFEALYETYMDAENNPFMLWEIMDRESFLPIIREMVGAGDLFVYEIEGAVAAAYRLTRKQHRLSHVAYLGSFAVHPRFKRKGLGSQVMYELMEDVSSQGVKRLELLVVNDNKKAVEFYKKLGFKVEGYPEGVSKESSL